MGSTSTSTSSSSSTSTSTSTSTSISKSSSVSYSSPTSTKRSITTTCDGTPIFFTASAKPGDTVIQVNHVCGLKKGDLIILGQGLQNEEIHRIVGFGSIILETPLKF